MPETTTTLRLAKPEDREHAIASIVAAFITDPVNRYVMPTPQLYLSTMPLVTRHFGGGAVDHGTAWIGGDFAGVAFWLPPGAHSDQEALGELMAQRLTPDRIEHMGPVLEQMLGFHPEEPHWYLAMIGVDPHARGLGIGAALMEAALERVDADGLPAYLESSNPRNISLYERHGFEVIGEIQVGPVPVITPMIRRAR